MSLVGRLWLCWLACLFACIGEENSLSGSIGEAYELEFDSVRTRFVNKDLLIEYLKGGSSGAATHVARLIIDTEGLDLRSGSKISGQVFLERVDVQRIAPTGGDFPEVSSGAVSFDRLRLVEGGNCDGTFETVFKIESRTLHGEFFGKVQTLTVE